MNDVPMNDKWNGVWMTCKSGRVEFQSVSLGRRWSREDRIGEKCRFSVACGIEWKTVRGESRTGGLSK